MQADKGTDARQMYNTTTSHVFAMTTYNERGGYSSTHFLTWIDKESPSENFGERNNVNSDLSTRLPAAG